MEKRFKTNINCGGCVEKVTPFLDKVEGIKSWKVDTNDADKILTVETEGAGEEQVVEAVKKAGFNIEVI